MTNGEDDEADMSTVLANVKRSEYRFCRLPTGPVLTIQPISSYPPDQSWWECGVENGTCTMAPSSSQL